jgi:hypothetical protein
MPKPTVKSKSSKNKKGNLHRNVTIVIAVTNPINPKKKDLES